MTLSLARSTRPAAVHSHQLGDHRITYLPDGVALLEPAAWLPDSNDRVWAQDADLINPDGFLVASVGALLVEHGEQAILIDAGFGPSRYPPISGCCAAGSCSTASRRSAKPPPTSTSSPSPTCTWTTSVGYRHILRTTQEALSPTFPSRSGAPNGNTPNSPPPTAHPARSSTSSPTKCAPSVRARKSFPVSPRWPTPGHSLGHTSYLIESGGRRLFAFGDALTTPAQITHPHLTTVTDDEPALSRATAMRLLDELPRPTPPASVSISPTFNSAASAPTPTGNPSVSSNSAAAQPGSASPPLAPSPVYSLSRAGDHMTPLPIPSV